MHLILSPPCKLVIFSYVSTKWFYYGNPNKESDNYKDRPRLRRLCGELPNILALYILCVLLLIVCCIQCKSDHEFDDYIDSILLTFSMLDLQFPQKKPLQPPSHLLNLRNYIKHFDKLNVSRKGKMLNFNPKLKPSHTF